MSSAWGEIGPSGKQADPDAPNVSVISGIDDDTDKRVLDCDDGVHPDANDSRRLSKLGSDVNDSDSARPP